jgi:phosphoglycerol transferase MdoB-like AlkP superfamily enzyme
MTKLKLNYGLRPVLTFFIIAIAIFTLSRLSLVIWHYDLCKDDLLTIFTCGLRYDFSINCTMFALALLIGIVMNFFKVAPKWLVIVETILLSVIITADFLVELSTPPFMQEYGVRPNQLYVEYLIYPKEVVSMLLNGHLFETILTLILSIAVFVGAFKLAKRLYKGYETSTKARNIIALIAVLVIIPLGIRGSIFDHKPLNISNAAFSNSPLANSIPNNSAFSVFYALRHLGETSVKGSEIFAFDDYTNVLVNLPKISKRDYPEKIDMQCPINQVITPKVTGHKRNVVILLEESFGARYVESLGGDPIAPNLEKLKEEGWWFEKIYATGHRSVRGIEAVTASYPISPLPSQVKIDHKSELTTAFSIFKKLGYKTSFIYGGESHFDNMRNYFYQNGVVEIVEQKDYQNPEFVASWGVSDEDLFKKANKTFVKLSQANEPFCSIVFSSSFHDPFDIPQGKVNIDGVQTDDPRRLTAAKYADYALGKFFEAAKKEDYYKNTIFLVIADHDSRVYGKEYFPLRNFSIPALIISPDVAPRKDHRVVSQIDMLPTLLSLAGVKGEVPLSGQDLTRDDIIERAMVAYHANWGYIHDGLFTLLVPDTLPVFCDIDDKNNIKPSKRTADLNVLISALNLPIAIYEKDMQSTKCIKNLKQE